MYSLSRTSLPSPFGNAKSGALSPTLSVVRGTCADEAAQAISSISDIRAVRIVHESKSQTVRLSTMQASAESFIGGHCKNHVESKSKSEYTGRILVGQPSDYTYDFEKNE